MGVDRSATAVQQYLKAIGVKANIQIMDFVAFLHKIRSGTYHGLFMTGYAQMAELPEHIHPHLLRHQMLTWLTAQGLPDAQIQLISGHSSKKSLEVYQHLSLETVAEAHQEAMKSVGV